MANQSYEIMTTIFSKMLPNLKAILSKAEADAAARKIDPQVFLQARLAPDMFALTRQIQIVTDQVKGGLARLAGVAVPSWEDKEATFGELIARVDKAIAYVREFKPAQFEGAETRKVELKFPNATLSFNGKDYLFNFVLPNFYFHMTTAYAILRHNGVALGKRDFTGN
jgi:hypothetical protein